MCVKDNLLIQVHIFLETNLDIVIYDIHVMNMCMINLQGMVPASTIIII